MHKASEELQVRQISDRQTDKKRGHGQLSKDGILAASPPLALITKVQRGLFRLAGPGCTGKFKAGTRCV